jgi:hypothetical protein
MHVYCCCCRPGTIPKYTVFNLSGEPKEKISKQKRKKFNEVLRMFILEKQLKF